MNTYIYTLKDPITNEIRYIGKANDPNKRILDHIKECKSSNKSHKISWVKSLLEKNLKPIVEILDEVSSEEWERCEQYWISQFKSWGFNLTNISKGGYDNSYKRNDVTKNKMRKSKLGTKLSKSQRDKISESIKKKASENPLYNRGKGNSRIILDKDELYQKYIIENLSLNKCASYFGVSKKTVFTNITEYNFKKKKDDWYLQLFTNPYKSVIQYSLDGKKISEFLSASDANKATGTNISSISNCCLGRQRSAGGFIWKYK
jgi:hypothetical protein